MEKELDSKEMKDLYQAFLQLKTTGEVKNFLRDLCTFSEMEAICERFQMARLIYQGEPYRVVAEKTKGSTATVTRVAHWLRHGMGGYKKVLERMFGKKK